MSGHRNQNAGSNVAAPASGRQLRSADHKVPDAKSNARTASVAALPQNNRASKKRRGNDSQAAPADRGQVAHPDRDSKDDDTGDDDNNDVQVLSDASDLVMQFDSLTDAGPQDRKRSVTFAGAVDHKHSGGASSNTDADEERIVRLIKRCFNELKGQDSGGAGPKRSCPTCHRTDPLACMCAGSFCSDCGKKRWLKECTSSCIVAAPYPLPPAVAAAPSGKNPNDHLALLSGRGYADLREWAGSTQVEHAEPEEILVTYNPYTGSSRKLERTYEYVSDAGKWCLCWQNYTAKLLEWHGEDRKGLEHYQHFILKKALNHTWPSVYSMDKYLRQQGFNGQPINLDAVGFETMTEALRRLIEKPETAPVCERCGISGHLGRHCETNPPWHQRVVVNDQVNESPPARQPQGRRDGRPRPRCNQFNTKDGCSFGANCKFSHTCRKCNSDAHGEHSCTK